MAIPRGEVERIAALAGLRLGERELAEAERTLSRILDYMARIAEVPVDGVEACANPWPGAAPLRDDEPRPDEAAASHLAGAPDREGPWLRVPLVVDRDA